MLFVFVSDLNTAGGQQAGIIIAVANEVEPQVQFSFHDISRAREKNIVTLFNANRTENADSVYSIDSKGRGVGWWQDAIVLPLFDRRLNQREVPSYATRHVGGGNYNL